MKKLDPVDIAVGENIRVLRRETNMTQRELAHKLGLSFQQVQKYERGHSRVGSSTLAKLARIFSVKVDRFFDAEKPAEPAQTSILALEPESPLELTSPQVVRMQQALAKIPDSEMRRALVNLTEIIAEQFVAAIHRENEKH